MENIEKHLVKLAAKPVSVIVRTSSEENAWKIISNSVKAGIEFIEITLTVPNALQLIKKAATEFENVLIGAGTVLTVEEAKQSIAAGAHYLVSPVYCNKILKWSLKKDILYVPGVMTVNEMYQAYNAGAKLLKLYPSTYLNPEILSLISNPFPDFKILATGGINLDNLEQYFKNGVFAVGITDELGGAAESTTAKEIKDLAKKYLSKTLSVVKERG